MSMRRLSFLALALSLALLVAACGGAKADDYPKQSVRLVVGFGAGGGTDQMARQIQPFLQKTLNTSVVVENKPGGGAEVATTAIHRGQADGYEVLVNNQPDLDMSVMRGASYTYDDIAIVAVQAIDPRMLVVRKDSPWNTLADFVNAAKAKPGSVAISVVQGSAQHIFAQWLLANLKLDVKLVGYPGGGEARAALVGKQVDASVGDDFSSLNMRSEVKSLGVGGAKPSPRWPEAKTFEEQLKAMNVQMPGATFGARYQIYAVSKNLKAKSPARYEKLQKALVQALKEPDYLKDVEKKGYTDLLIGEAGEKYVPIFAAMRDSYKQTLDAMKK